MLTTASTTAPKKGGGNPFFEDESKCHIDEADGQCADYRTSETADKCVADYPRPGYSSRYDSGKWDKMDSLDCALQTFQSLGVIGSRSHERDAYSARTDADSHALRHCRFTLIRRIIMYIPCRPGFSVSTSSDWRSLRLAPDSMRWCSLSKG